VVRKARRQAVYVCDNCKKEGTSKEAFYDMSVALVRCDQQMRLAQVKLKTICHECAPKEAMRFEIMRKERKDKQTFFKRGGF
jgi:DNA replicative helicase MCM subunit Mcm2 (Cdc46/Mcm family)